MKNRVIFIIGVGLLLLFVLAMSPLCLHAQVPQNVQKLSGALTQGFTVPTGVTISATGTGSIAATTVTGFAPAAGKVLTVSNSLTLAGTDGRTHTFPTTNSTVARTDAAQTFTGTQTFGSLVATTFNGNTFTAGTGVLTIATSKTLTASNTLTFTGTDGSSVAFGAGGTVAYTSASVASITGTANQVLANGTSGSAQAGAITLTLPQSIATTSGPTFATVTLSDGTSQSVLGGATAGTSPVFYVNLNATAYASLPRVGTADYNNSLSIFGKDGTTANLTIAGYGSNSAFRMDAANGTAASPTAITTGTQIGSFQWRGYNGTSFATAASVIAYAEENFTGSVNGTGLSIRTSAVGAGAVQVMAIRGNGNVLLSLNGGTNLGTDNLNGKLQILSTGATDGLALGSRSAEVIYRTANDSLRTDSSWTVAGTTGVSIPPLFTNSVFNANRVMQVSFFASTPTLDGVRAQGTSGAPSAVGNNNTMLSMAGVGYDGTVYVAGGGVNIVPIETWGASAHGTKITFNTTRVGQTGGQDRVTIGDYGKISQDFANAGASSAWGTVGAAYAQTTGTITDTSSSGTVATATINSYSALTLAASSSTTYTDAATIYLGGGPIAGGSVTISNSWGLWNVGKTRLDSAVAFGTSGANLTGGSAVLNYATSVGGSTLVQLTNNSTAGVINIARLSSSALSCQISGVLGDNVTSGLRLSYGGGGQSAIEIGSSLIGFYTNTATTLRASIDDAGGLNLQIASASKSAWGLNGAAFRVIASTLTDSTTSGSSTVATNVLSSFAITTLAATNSSITYTDASTIYLSGAPAAGTNVTLTRKHALATAGGRVTLAWTGSTSSEDGVWWGTDVNGFRSAANTLTFTASSGTVFTGKITTLGGATFHTTSSALTDGAGANVATLTNSPVTGNPTKWIGINDNGTTRYIPAF